MRLKIARRIVNRNRWKFAELTLKDKPARNKSEEYLFKQIEKAKEVIYDSREK